MRWSVPEIWAMKLVGSEAYLGVKTIFGLLSSGDCLCLQPTAHRTAAEIITAVAVAGGRKSCNLAAKCFNVPWKRFMVAIAVRADW